MPEIDRLPSPGIPTRPIPRLDLDSPEVDHYVQRGLPFVTKVNWPAIEKWNRDYLDRQIGQVLVPSWRTSGERVEIPVSRWLQMRDDPEGAGAGYAHQNYPVITLWHVDPSWGPNPHTKHLLADIEMPRFIDEKALGLVYLWYRNPKTFYDNRSHAEPPGVANFNVQIQGRKHVWLFPPTESARVGTLPSDFSTPMCAVSQTAYSPADNPKFAEAICYETVLETGHALYIPAWWFHWFVHYPTPQLNLTFWWCPPTFELNPLSAVWGYLNALCMALGGFDKAEAALAKLPRETRELLGKIEQAFLDEPLLTSPLEANLMRRGISKVPADPSLFEEDAEEVSGV